ncbi:MAG: hypothetical protein ACK4WH_06095 [Phycisphaerales bacterium]
MTPPTPPTPPSPPAGSSRAWGSAPRTTSPGNEAGNSPRRLWLTGQPGSDDSGPGAEQFDALTDLFLGEVARPSRKTESHRRDLGGGAAEGGPRLRLIGGEEDDQVVRVAGGASAASESQAGPASPTPDAHKARTPFVECLIVGSLPVLASAWASQYIREIAEAGGKPVVAVRMQAGFVTVDLIGPPPSSVFVLDARSESDLETALRAAAAMSDRWVLRVDPSDEAALATRKLVRLVTLLTGADEASRVNAYGSLKQLAEKLPAASDSEDAENGPVIRVAVMSAGGDEAPAAAARIVETARQKLGRGIQHAVCSARIKATNPPTMLFNGRTDLTAAALLELLERTVGFDAAGGGVWVSKITPADGAVEPSTDRRMTEESPAIETVAADLALADEPANVEVPPRTGAAIAATAQPVDDIRLWADPAAGSAAPSARSARSDPGSLAAHVQSLRAVSLVCPYASEVQFAVGEGGTLHILGHARGDDEGMPGRLMAASAWAEAHKGLIDAALGVRTSDQRPRLHLFTERPVSARALLDTDVRVHVLAPVTVDGKVGWYCAELN